MAGKGGIAIPLNWCVFEGFESMRHDIFSMDEELLKLLPNVYAVCIATRSKNPRIVVGGFFVRTSHTHNSPGFSEALGMAMASIPAFEKFEPDLHSFLPAHVRAPLDITEEEMLKILLSQKLKFTTGGVA